MVASENAHGIPETDSQIQVVSFELDGEVFAVDILEVQEITRVLEVRPIPEAPMFLEGVINLRGKVIPVMDLRKRLHLAAGETNAETRMIVVKNEGRPVALLVDSVSEVLRLPIETLEEAPDMVSPIDARYIRRVAKQNDRILILLDVAQLMAPPARQPH
jgi:purine-binding chemotaxis protein CheW